MSTSTANITKARHKGSGIANYHVISVGGSDEDCRDRR
jgi:hypothetical protein